MKHTRILLMLAMTWTAVGCQQNQSVAPSEYQTVAEDPRRNTDTAMRLHHRGVELLKQGQYEQAETAFRDALQADLFHGPAHNNLGITYFEQKKYYLAAWEFQFAVKLMPEQPRPKNNLGMVFEAVGKLEEAEQWYADALALVPDSAEVAGNLARVRIRRDRKDQRTVELLEKIVLKSESSRWTQWAREQLSRIRPNTVSPPTP